MKNRHYVIVSLTVTNEQGNPIVVEEDDSVAVQHSGRKAVSHPAPTITSSKVDTSNWPPQKLAATLKLAWTACMKQNSKSCCSVHNMSTVLTVTLVQSRSCGKTTPAGSTPHLPSSSGAWCSSASGTGMMAMVVRALCLQASE